MLSFVEEKSPDIARVSAILDSSRAANMWANRGPVYRDLAAAFADHLSLPPDRTVVPCANGGVALEAMARLHDVRAGRRLRWVGSAFSFKNLGRGYFADMRFVDCGPDGLLDLDALAALDPGCWDGLVLVNPFGQAGDMEAHVRFAKATGKPLLIDNAAGLGRPVADWSWQAFSLHHTKPYGMGEGGLAVVPTEDGEALYELLNYGARPAAPEAWLNNGKISDIACAFHLERLERHDVWVPRYLEQAERVDALAAGVGYAPLQPVRPGVPATSRAYLWPDPLPACAVGRTRHLVCSKYYDPLADLAGARGIHARLVNVPTHPDVARLTGDEVRADLERLAVLRD